VFILGLTGSIAMGKTVAAGLLRRLRVPVHDADRAVHALLAAGGRAVPAVERAFPGVVRHGSVDRAVLGSRVFGEPAALRRLEAILHPMVRASTLRFLAMAARRRARIVVLDVPLLFETASERRMDGTIVVWAPRFLQRQRALARPGMTPERLAAIGARQMPESGKRQRADYCVTSALGRRETLRGLRRIVRLCRQRRGRRWSPGYRKA
jgi:dephospho-CoA kinase